MTYDPLFDCIFWDDSESLLSLVWFGQIIGQIYVNPGFTGQKGKIPTDPWIIWLRAKFATPLLFDHKFGSVKPQVKPQRIKKAYIRKPELVQSTVFDCRKENFWFSSDFFFNELVDDSSVS